METKPNRWVGRGVALVALILPATAVAVDGVVEINHVTALKGSITAGDAAGYPVTISEPGSYRLTGDLTQPNANTHVIDITTDGVTVDLNGFGLLGSAVCNITGAGLTCSGGGSGDGITTSGSIDSVHIRNGRVDGMGRRGIDVGRASIVEDVIVLNCGSDGIYASHTTIVRRTTARQNAGSGIYLGGTGVVRDCRASNNGTSGIRISWGSVRDCDVTNNAVHGVHCTTECLISGIYSSRNDDGGIYVSDGASGSLVRDNLLLSNGGLGLRFPSAGAHSYGGNQITANSGGTVSAAGVQIGTNTCNGNTTCP